MGEIKQQNICVLFIPDGKVHPLKIGEANVLFYCLSLDPTFSFSYNLLNDENVISLFPKMVHLSDKEKFNILRNILREGLVSRDILKYRDRDARIIKIAELVRKISEGAYV